MNENQLYTVIAIDGAFLDAADSNTDSQRFHGLTWEEAVTLARLAFGQGFEIVLWQVEEPTDTGQ